MTKRFYITKGLDALEFEAVTEWGYAKHKHHFFELTFILEGSGQHILNDNIIQYSKGDVFFLTPKDEHEFIIVEPSKFGIIKFTEQFFLEKASFSSSIYWKKNLETIIFYSNIIAESIICYESDKPQLFGLYELIKNELTNQLSYNRNVLSELFGALLIILSRNLKSSTQSLPPISDKDKIDTILSYIRQNVLDKEQVKIQTIAEEFFMSPNYIGAFIKKHTGLSIQQYVIKTRIQMAEQLLKQSNLSINEIANKTGFTDASHLNRTFKKYNGSTPSNFKLQHKSK